MKKRIVALFMTFAMLTAFIPSAMAAYSDYVGNYYTLNTDSVGYAAMDILSCDENSITIDFQRTKDDLERNVYTCHEGTVNGNTATIPFTATRTEDGQTFTGTITLTLGGLISIKAYSRDARLYEGTLPKVTDGSHIVREGSTPVQPSSPSTAASDVKVNLNGSDIVFPENVSPQIINDYTFVPLRSVFSNMGINVYWDQYVKSDILTEQLITCSKDNTIIQFARTINESGSNTWSLKTWKDSNTTQPATQTLDITELQPVLIVDTSYVPLRVISEAFGASVNWNNDTRTVVINCDTSNTNWMDPQTIATNEDYTLDAAKKTLSDHPEYSATIPFTSPYFSPEGKFYMFDTNDIYGRVNLMVFYNGYLKVVSDNPGDAVETSAPVVEPTHSDDVTPIGEPIPTEEATPSEEPVPTLEPTSLPA